MSNTDSLLMILNTTGLAKSDPRLYQVLKDLIDNLLKTEQSVAVVSTAVISGVVTAVTATAPITSSGGTTPDIAISDTAVTPGTYGDAANVGQFTVDQKGRLTFADNVPITPASAGDYVVAGDGVQPPTPLDDGVGNFVYVVYTP